MKTLVIRSASLERFDALAQKLGLNAGYTDPVEVLTHPHATEALRANYPTVTVVEYPYTGGFCRHAVKQMVRAGSLAKDHSEIIVLCGNVSGGGHFNAIRAAHEAGSNVFLFNTAGELVPAPPAQVRREATRRLLLFPAAVFGTILVLALGVPWLAACLILGKAVSGKNSSEKTG
ncbi:MAG: hypothetical protein HZA04_08455 [Nitrospinae bacterium]|nr:hypothetical protein [Nitrospinota bacterium]